MGLTSRVATTDEDAKRLFVSLIACHAEVGRDTGDPDKAFQEVYLTMKEDAVFMVEDENGEIVGSCGIYEVPGGFFYGNMPYLHERWFYVRPDHRQGAAFRLLLQEVKTLCDTTGLMCMLRIFNFKRAQAKTELTRIGEDLAYLPAGAVVQVSPKGES